MYLVLKPALVAVPAVADSLSERRQAELFSVAANSVLFGREGHPARVAALSCMVRNLKPMMSDMYFKNLTNRTIKMSKM